MITQRLRIKYCNAADKKDEIGQFIYNEVETLFSGEHFDEFQLMDIDKRLKEKSNDVLDKIRN